MKSYSTAVLLSLVLTAGCADRGDNNAQNADGSAVPAARPEGSAAAPAAPEGQPGRAEDTAGARATSGNRANRSADRATPRSSAAASRGTAETPSSAARREEWREVTVPSGTALPLELETELSSETAEVETPVRARLTQAIMVNGNAALPAGAILSGTVTDVARAGKVKGRSRLAFTFHQLRADNLSGNVKINPIVYEGEASKGEDATKVGAGAVGGAIVGGILGGKGGAAKGAAIGGAAGTGVVLATRGKEVKLASGTDLAATLAEPFTVRVPLR